MIQKIAVFWFRRDLRTADNHGLFKALDSGVPVLPVFIFDTHILQKVSAKDDARVTFIYNEIIKLRKELEKYGSSVRIFHSTPMEAFEQLLKDFEVVRVYSNKDYEPYGLERDRKINDFLTRHGVGYHMYKDHVIFEENEVVKDNKEPYTVYTPYNRMWRKRFRDNELIHYPSEERLDGLFKVLPGKMPELKDLGFKKSEFNFPSSFISKDIIKNYSEVRNLPSVRGTTRLGIHLRFGTISIRKLVSLACNLSEVFLDQLIWREFFMMILWHFPHVVDHSFKPQYDFIQWRNNEQEFKRWCKGETGYPFVDAGMRELNETGFMHNRARMITASFLTKYLLIDWRWGEAYFAEKLLDYELASNNGNWQWASGSGCDAAPYFRIFNPDIQQKRFDAEGKYVSKWIDEYGTRDYVQPMVDHKLARARAMNAYKQALNEDVK